MSLKTILLASIILAPVATYAQESGAAVNQRQYNQQGRIAQGVRSGELTHGETRNLEHQERSINHEENAMRAQDGGHLTRGDRAVLQHQQNRVSRNIARDKHNDRVR